MRSMGHPGVFSGDVRAHKFHTLEHHNRIRIPVRGGAIQRCEGWRNLLAQSTEATGAELAV